MSDLLQQAIVAIKTGDPQRGRQLLSKVLKADPLNDEAWVWLANIASTGDRRRTCLDRALAINPANAAAQQALIDWLIAPEDAPADIPADNQRRLPAARPPRPDAPIAPEAPALTDQIRPVAGTTLPDFLIQLNKNYNILKEREAKYGGTAAPLELLNQIDDYEQAIALTEEAIKVAAPLEDLQTQFSTLNLQISTVVFVAKEPPRKPFMGQNPYRGLHKFTEDDARFFFGRNAAIQNLLDMTQYLVETETSQQLPDLMAVLGPSGSGKSSLVRAGLIPALRAGRIAGSQLWPIKVMLPGSHPIDSLAQTFVGEVGRDLAGIRARLAQGEKALHDLMIEAMVAAGKPEEAVFVLVIDQFEELFTLCDDETERRAFIDQILYATQAMRNRSFIILTMRSDFYSKVAAYKSLAQAVTRHQLLVSPMTEKELREAILLPAEAVGLELEKALVETLLKDTFDAPGVLPLLQHALLELFHRRDGNLLTLEAYQEINGVKGALAHRADSVINDLTAEQQRIARRIFMRLTRLGEGAADTRRRATFDEVLSQDTEASQVEAIIQTLTNANLVTTSHDPETNQMVLDISHEALIQEWPLLRHWLNEDRRGLRIRYQLSQAAREWESRGRDEDSLYRGARLLEIEEWGSANPGEINPLEQTFLEASLEAREREAAEKEAQRQRELEAARRLAQEAEARQQAEEQRAREAEARAIEQAQAANSLRRRALWLAAVLGLAVLLAIAAAGFGVSSTRNANLAATREAEAEANANLAATRAAEAQESANLAATRAAEARMAQATAVAEKERADIQRDLADRRGTIAQAGQLAAYARSILDNQFDLALLLSLASLDLLESNQIADISAARSSLLAGVAHHPFLATFLHGHLNFVNSVAFSPDGRILASGSADGTLILWDVAGRQPLGEPLAGHTGRINSVAFSPDGQILASGGEDDTIILWDVASRAPLAEPLFHGGDGVNSVAFSPDGQILASAGNGATVILWAVASGQLLGEPLLGHDSAVNSVAFSSDGQLLASASDDSTIILWDVASGEAVSQPLEDHNDAVRAIAFNPDGRLLASGSDDGTIILWDVATGQRLGEPWLDHADSVRSVAFSPDGRLLASASEDNTVILREVATGNFLMKPLTGHGSGVTSVAFSPGGQLLASGGEDRKIALWDLTLNQPLGQPLAGHTDSIYSIAFSPAGQIVVSGGADGNIIIWDVASGELLSQAAIGQGQWIRSMAVSPDGRMLALGSGDGPIILWDLADNQPLGEPLTGHRGMVISVAFSPDGRLLASASDETIILWDVARRQPLVEPLAGHKDRVNGLAFSPDGRLLASASDDETIILWDVARRQPRGEPLVGHGDWVYSVAFSPDGQLLASGSEDNNVILWDVTSGLQHGEPLAGHGDAVWSVAFSPDGQMLASSSWDGKIILWDATTGEPMGEPLAGHTAPVWDLDFSPDSQLLVSGSGDTTAMLWNLNFESWRVLACRRANRNLSLFEWEQFLGPDMPYSPVCPEFASDTAVAGSVGDN